MDSFLGLYFDAAYSDTWGPRPLQPLAQFVASVRHYAHVYEVLTFAHAAGILPTHPSNTTSFMSRTPGRASRLSSPRHSQRDSTPASSMVNTQLSNTGSDSPLRPSSSISRTRPSTAPAQHHPRLSSSPQHQSFTYNTTTAARQSPTSAAAAEAVAVVPSTNPTVRTYPSPAVQQQNPRGGRGSQPQLSQRQRRHQGAAAAAADMLALVPVPRANAPASSATIPYKARPGSAMPTSHSRFLSTAANSRVVGANRPATAGATPLGQTQEPFTATEPATPGAGVQEEGGKRSTSDGLQSGDSSPAREHGLIPHYDAGSPPARPSASQTSYLGQDAADVTTHQNGHLQLGGLSGSKHMLDDLPRSVVVHEARVPLPAGPLRCALRTPDMGVAMDALRALAGAEDVVRNGLITHP
eukprot:1161131-Pelagomonas_calceolata.AAC.9